MQQASSATDLGGLFVHRVIPRYLKLCLVLLLFIVLAACNTAKPINLTSTPNYVASVDISAQDTQASIEALYGGKTILFKPEAGFAILGFSEAQASLASLSTEANLDTFASPDLTASGSSAWASGSSAWASGSSAWASGSSAWASGSSAWASGSSAWASGSSAWASGGGFVFNEETGEAVWQGNEQTFTPLDNHFAWQQIGLYEAHHNLATNLGKDVIVAVIDTGIDLEHPVFENRLVAGWDFIDGDAIPQEASGSFYGHGTGVAGIILQVAPQALIMPIRILDGNGQGDTDDLILAIDWAIEQGADIINLSLGSEDSLKTVEKLIEVAGKQGIATVSAVGNSGDEAVLFPAVDSVKEKKTKNALVGVGSVNSQDVKSSFSSFKKDKVETVAPGEFIFSAYPDGRVAYFSGTSFATPMVSGGLALAMGQANLDKKAKDLPKLITEKVFTDIYNIEGNRDFKDKIGEGRLDLVEFLNNVLKLD